MEPRKVTSEENSVMSLRENTTETTKSSAATAGVRRRQHVNLRISGTGHGAIIGRDISSVVRSGSLKSRRSGDFPLPVRYKYAIMPGNNSRAVLAAFRRRPWWEPARKEKSTHSTPASARGGNREKLGKCTNGGKEIRGFNLWWETYVSRPVIEAANRNANLRQAVNHFEFNSTLVSKKGLHRSLNAYLNSGGITTLANIVPETFYLVGGAMKAEDDVPHEHSSTRSDDRAKLLAFCAARDAGSTAIPHNDGHKADFPLNWGAQEVEAQLAHPSLTSYPRNTPLESIKTKTAENQQEDICETTVCGQSRTTKGNINVEGRMGNRGNVFGTRADSSGVSRGPFSDRNVPSVVHKGDLSHVVSAGTPLSRPQANFDCNCDSVDTTPNRSDQERQATRIKSGEATEVVPSWVVKPAANSNCGFGIEVCCSLQEVLSVIDDPKRREGRNGWMVQRYIKRPLLIRGRKFDIRMFVLLVADPSTSSWRRRSKSLSSCSTIQSNIINSLSSCVSLQSANLRNEKRAEDVSEVGGEHAKGTPAVVGPCPVTAWCHEDTYVRMSSVKYSNDPSKVKDRFVHLTNNAVQRRSSTYGRDEPGNKITLADVQGWLDSNGSKHQGKAEGWVEDTLRPRMHALVAISVAAAAAAGINKRGRPYAFELLGYDFMVDDDLQVWLIEVNSNPCLAFVCPLLQNIIQRVIDDTISVAVDSVFVPPKKHQNTAVGNEAVVTSTGDRRRGFYRVYPAM